MNLWALHSSTKPQYLNIGQRQKNYGYTVLDTLAMADNKFTLQVMEHLKPV